MLLLVPSATYRVADFLEAARVLGVEVVVGTEEAHALSGLMGSRALEVPLADMEAAVKAVVAHDGLAPLDAVVAVDDQGTVVAAEASARLGLPHNPPEAVAAARDKALMRASLRRAEVAQPAFAVVPGGTPTQEAVRTAAAVGFPCVVKPTTLSGSQGVLRADDEAEAALVVERVRSIAHSAGLGHDAPLLVEQFVSGPEVAVEAVLRHGILDILAVFDKPDPLDGPSFEETIYVTPSRLPVADLEAAATVVDSACRAIGLTEGPVHAEVRVSQGRAALIEVAARTIGGLCSRTLRFGAGRSLEQLVLAQALEMPLSDRAPDSGAAGVLMIPIPRAGVLTAVNGVEQARLIDTITEVDLTIAVGRPVAPPPEGNRYLGFVFSRGPDPQTVEARLRDAWRTIEVEVCVSTTA